MGPLPEHSYYYFKKADLSLGPYAFSRAYLNFVKFDDMIVFKEKFHGYVFVDSHGSEYTASVESAPFQKIPSKKPLNDKLVNTIDSDPDYKQFLESLETSKHETLPSAEIYLEELEAKYKELKSNHGCPKITTPLSVFVSMKLQNKLHSKSDKKRSKAKPNRHPDDEGKKKGRPPPKDSKDIPLDENKPEKKKEPRKNRRSRAKDDKPVKVKTVQPEKKVEVMQKQKPIKPRQENGETSRLERRTSTESKDSNPKKPQTSRKEGNPRPRERNKPRPSSDSTEERQESKSEVAAKRVLPTKSVDSESRGEVRRDQKPGDTHRNNSFVNKNTKSDRLHSRESKGGQEGSQAESRAPRDPKPPADKNESQPHEKKQHSDQELKKTREEKGERKEDHQKERPRRVRNKDRPEIEIYRPRARRSEGGSNDQSTSTQNTPEASSHSRKDQQSDRKSTEKPFKTRFFKGSSRQNN